jgi:predicted nucleic acid-binding protein
MSSIVIDSSVVAKWVLPESDSAQAQLLVADASARGDRLVVLDLVFSEVGNAIWKRHRQGAITADEARDCWNDMLSSPVHVEATIPLMTRALEIAMSYDRAVYDALFVALSESLAAEGITADEPLFHVVNADFPQITLLRNR